MENTVVLGLGEAEQQIPMAVTFLVAEALEMEVVVGAPVKQAVEGNCWLVLVGEDKGRYTQEEAAVEKNIVFHFGREL
ncbi:hypothetical protein SLE2022_274760 [Rubroshorea leprosula]